MKQFSFVFLLLVSLAFLSVSSKRKVDWNELKSLKIYDTKTLPITDEFPMEFSDSDTIRFVETNLPRTQELLEKAKCSRRNLALWKGYHYATAEFNNGDKATLMISTSGGFFFDKTNKVMYEFKNAMDQKEWDIFLNSVYHELYKG